MIVINKQQVAFLKSTECLDFRITFTMFIIHICCSLSYFFSLSDLEERQILTQTKKPEDMRAGIFFFFFFNLNRLISRFGISMQIQTKIRGKKKTKASKTNLLN